MKLKKKYLIGLTLPAVIIALDQITKAMIVERFRLNESISIIEGFFNLTYVRNTGAAFGLLADAHPSFRVPFFLIVPVVAMIAIVAIFRKIADTDYKMAVALSLVIGGAIGNLVDRITLKYVVDFLDFHWKSHYHFPAFNVADSAICVGVGLLTLDLLKQPVEEKSDASSPV